MKSVFSRARMRAFDAFAIERCSVPGVVLMENAGRGATDVIERELLGGRARGARVVVACGTGNNGGDGFVVARHLVTRGADVRVFLSGDAAKVKGDAKTNLDAWIGVGGRVLSLDAGRAFAKAMDSADAVVDAFFGTGLDRPITGRVAEAIGALNAARTKRVAVDVPSGMNADTGGVLGVAVSAHVTVTFGHLKLGLLTPGAARLAGAVHVVDIGVPASLPVGDPDAHLVERSDVAALTLPRGRDAHKNSAGHVVVLGGSPGKTGASRLVARAALRSGAGLATIATWSDAARAMEPRAMEEMYRALDRKNVAKSVDAALQGARAIVVGPGLGLDDAAHAAVVRALAKWTGPAVLDADALTLLAADGARAFAKTRAGLVLTPHPGEAARLLGVTSAEVESDRFAAVRELASRTKAVVLLKGAFTLVADPSGRVVVNPTGGPALATAGSGDTLAGIIGALLCTLAPFDAAMAGAWIHGAAADAWSQAHGGADRGLLASEIAGRVPAVLAALSREHARVPR